MTPSLGRGVGIPVIDQTEIRDLYNIMEQTLVSIPIDRPIDRLSIAIGQKKLSAYFILQQPSAAPPRLPALIRCFCGVRISGRTYSCRSTKTPWRFGPAGPLAQGAHGQCSRCKPNAPPGRPCGGATGANRGALFTAQARWHAIKGMRRYAMACDGMRWYAMRHAYVMVCDGMLRDDM